ncbi:DUF6907 domain-containing protein [Streptomyces sp. NPDC087440]|uniref:DUF6907 domain-containing protein n=1 Tax=Streptomyces sp. NPDC087440 TaxID=3365790 RepID=UPI00382C612C
MSITVSNPVKPGVRLVPAMIGKVDREQRVYIECPAWCVIDHVAEPETHVEDISHTTGSACIVGMSLTKTGIIHALHSTVRTDPSSDDPRLKAAHVVVDDESEDAYMTPDMAEEFADALISFASAVRQQARAARLANLPADSDPDIDEALRRVRERDAR